ncbi:MAG: methyltransferase domain-containing protein [Candidatus Pacebacteria bacterium]|nr:methyltransferase domain-containing protein [Candidatus Paceibacterota bacterium]
MKKEIIFLSQPQKVNMGDDWFEIANGDHFWIKRRFSVFKKIYKRYIKSNHLIGEIGCGSGIFQKQYEDFYDSKIDGFDLNIKALENSCVEKSSIFCYDISERRGDLKNKYDILILFDVIEHIENDEKFIDDVKFHLKKNGKIIINVPANQWLFSDYDRVVGHMRRYDKKDFYHIEKKCNLKLITWTYWGAFFVPIIILRKILLKRKKDASEIIQNGFNPKNKFLNKIMSFIGNIEFIPQHLLGSSLMCIFEKSDL